MTEAGWAAFERAMPEALSEQNDDWLVQQMRSLDYWMPKHERLKSGGGFSLVDYDKEDAIQRLCVGEFNIAYIRGLANALIARGNDMCLVYRAGTADEPRAECTAWENERFPLQQVLNGHRRRYFPPTRRAL